MCKLIIGHTEHNRVNTNKFKYPLYMLEVDTSQLKQLNAKTLIGYNQTNLLSIHDSDFLYDNNKSIDEKIRPILKEYKRHQSIEKTILITIPRFIKKTFRPVNFFLSYDKHNELIGMIAEVTNTYKESYFYKVEKNEQSKRIIIDKEFHVSPFFEEKGSYEFNIIDNHNTFEVHMNYEIDGKKIFYANFVGKKYELTKKMIAKITIQYPLTCLLVYPRILYQAAILKFKKKLNHFSKPNLPKNNVLRHQPVTMFQNIVLKKLRNNGKKIKFGQCNITFPNIEPIHLGNKKNGIQANINVQSMSFLKSVQTSGEIGLGESYMKGEWTSNKPANVIAFMIENKKQLDKSFNGVFYKTISNIIKHRKKHNSKKNSKKNIQEHYDLGNDFYKLFLDNTMIYSSGLFKNKKDTLEDSQKQKVDTLISKLNIKENDHVLEIGSGWGYTALTLAQQYKCKVTTITLSHEQKKYTEELIKKNNCDHLITVKIEDYRTVKGEFDAIISIEMIEAVGHKYLSNYFEVCNNRLKKNGVLAIQAITYPDKYYKHYNNGTDFIRKHIFPGGHLPSLEIIKKIINKHTQLDEFNKLNIAQSYATTLTHWRDSLLSKKDQLYKMGFSDAFINKWDYYFAYCEAAFSTDYLGCYQLHYKKK